MATCLLSRRPVDDRDAVALTRDGRVVGYLHPEVYVESDEPESLRLSAEPKDPAALEPYREEE